MNIWVGEVEGEVRVYDPSIQLPDCPHVFLWEPSSGEMGKFIADLTRKRIKRHREPEVATSHIAAYLQWHTLHGAAWIEDERRYYASRAVREAEQEQKRIKREQERLERLERERVETERAAEAERIARLTLPQRHKELIENLGKKYLGVRPAAHDPRRLRITHCYSCKQHLDNSINLECVSCNWILCNCGACGCGYEEHG